MTLGVECGYAAARGALVAGAAVAVGVGLAPLLRHARRRLAWGMLLLPYLTPALLLGYAYANHTAGLVHDPPGKEALYVALMALKLAPVAVVVCALGPRWLTPEATYLRNLAAGGRLARLRIGLAGPGVLAGAVVFLLAFGEFELASLLGVKTWTVTLFDAHAGGLALRESLRLVLLPALVEAAVLGGVAVLLLGPARCAVGREEEGGALPSRGRRAALWIHLGVAFALVTVLPCAWVFRDLAAGWAVLARDFVLTEEVGASLMMGSGAAALAYLGAGLLVSGRRPPLALVAVMCAPGLLGPLVLALLVVVLFQAPLLRGAYDTPLPLLFTQTLLLLPFALALRLAVEAHRPAESLHVARLLQTSTWRRARRRARHLFWTLRARPRAAVLFLLFCWGYFDLTASALLAPSNLTPVAVRLHNLAHYGRSAVLSAMFAVVVVVPLVVLLVGAGAGRLLARGASRG